jgi:hypothetical protein
VQRAKEIDPNLVNNRVIGKDFLMYCRSSEELKKEEERQISYLNLFSSKTNKPSKEEIKKQQEEAERERQAEEARKKEQEEEIRQKEQEFKKQ